MKKTGVERSSQTERSNSLKHLNEDELLDVFETARRRSARDHALLIVCFQHALRASELIYLRLGDIDWGTDFVFVSQKGRFNRNTVNRIFAKYCRLASEARVARRERPIGESCWHIHALKHSRVTSVVGKMDLYLVKLLAGHASLSSTLLYAHGSQKLACHEAQRVSVETFS